MLGRGLLFLNFILKEVKVMEMVKQIALLVIGMVFLVKGADWFVEGASNIARAMKIPTLIIGLTLVSMGTSAPELSVSITSAIQKANGMCFGNVIGSNIFNTFLIIGISALIIPLVISSDVKKFDIPIMVALYAIVLVFGFVISPNVIAWYEGLIMLILFLGYMVTLFLRSKKSVDMDVEEDKPIPPMWKNILFSVLGIAGIVIGGNFVVDSASYIAVVFGMGETLVGLTIVAIGTSLPELVTSVVAAIKKENDIAVGNVIGSNIFNIVLILGVSAIINPLSGMGTNDFIDLVVLLVSGVAIALIAFLSKNVKKWQGGLFVLAYIAYTTYIILRQVIANQGI